MKKIDTSLIVRLCLPQFAVGLFTTMLNNYLIYFYQPSYQPSKESGIPNLIPQGRIVLGILTIIGLIKAIGHIIDAVTDPLIAACSDKSRHPDGRRIPLMKKAAIPFDLCALLMFFAPLGKVSGLNAVWIAAFMWGYYFFFTLYMIPHNALIPSLVVAGAAAGENVGVPGLKLTAAAGSLFCLLAVFVFLRYREKDVLAAIAAGGKK